ncbi:SGM_5486 family transporter-associated protein [Streptomyces sp. NPDC000594]
MPVLDPHPQNGQKKLLMIFGLMLGFFVVVGIIATFAAPS